MSLDGLMIHDVTLLRAAIVEDRYGNLTKDFAAASSNQVKGWVSQQSRSEDRDGREAQVSDWICYLAAGIDVTGLDRVVWEGITFEVAAPVNPAWNPRLNVVDHLELQLRVVTG